MSAAQKDTFEYRNLENTYYAYEDVKNVTYSFYKGRGAAWFLDGGITDILIIVGIFCLVAVSISLERDKNFLILLKTTYNGKSKLAINKLLVMIAGCVSLVILFFGENAVITEAVYGFGSLKRPIQSVPGMEYCPILVSLGQYILIFIAQKLLFYIMCGAFFSLLCFIFRKSIWVYLTTAVLTGCLILLNNRISFTSKLSDLKILNPLYYFNVTNIYSKYKGIKIANIPVSVVLTVNILTLIIIVGCFTTGIIIFSKQKNVNKERMIVAFKSGYKKQHTNAFLHECYKVFISKHLALILILAGVVIGFKYEPIHETIDGEAGYYYKYYMEKYEGKYSDNTMKEIEEEIQKLETSVETETDESIIYASYMSIQALELIYEHGEYLEDKNNSWFLYDRGYNILIGGSISGFSVASGNAAVFAVLTILCITVILSVDYENGEICLINTTVVGKGRYLIYKLIIGGLISLYLWGISFLPELINTLSVYKTPAADAPAYSIEFLSEVPAWISIKGYIIMLYLFRLLCAFGIMLFIYAIVQKFRSYIISTCLATGAILIPILLYSIDVDFMKWVLFTPFLLGTAFFRGYKTFGICFSIVIAIAGCSIYKLKKRD